MRTVIREKLGDEEACPYLPEERARMRYRTVDQCAAETYQRMLERGWRRFGSLFFRPGCAACHECRSLRVDVGAFAPDRSMRRAWRMNRDLEVAVQAPTMTGEHLSLYERYHADMSLRKSWPQRLAEPFDYYLTFVHGRQEFGREALYRLDGRLVMVALVDVLPRSLSAVYTYYDPELRKRSLGVYSVLRLVAHARAHALPHVYLGYWVAGNASMRYKARYAPHEILVGRPELNDRPEWKAPAQGAATP